MIVEFPSHTEPLPLEKKQIWVGLSPWRAKSSNLIQARHIPNAWEGQGEDEAQINNFVANLLKDNDKFRPQEGDVMSYALTQNLDISSIIKNKKKKMSSARCKTPGYKQTVSKLTKNSKKYNRKKGICQMKKNNSMKESKKAELQIHQSVKTSGIIQNIEEKQNQIFEMTQFPESQTISSQAMEKTEDLFAVFKENQSKCKRKSLLNSTQILQQRDLNIISTLFTGLNDRQKPKTATRRDITLTKIKSQSKEYPLKKSQGKGTAFRNQNLFIFRRSDGLEKVQAGGVGKWNTGIWNAPFSREAKKPLQMHKVAISCPKNVQQNTKRAKNVHKLIF